jgi:hypothetical protein
VKSGLLLIERMILESLEMRAKNVIDLARDTTLSSAVISNVMPHLLMRSLVRYQEGIYHLVSLGKNRGKIIGEDSIEDELKELFSSLVNRYFHQESCVNNAQLRLKKVWLTEMEEAQFSSHLISLEKFLKEIEERGQEHEREDLPLSKQRVVFWGHSEYSQLLDGSLMAV